MPAWGAAHDRGVLHRDLKPANIMIDGRGHVRITDFGLARLAEHDSDGEIAGTPAYMAPEQLTRGESTIQSDLFSMGLILSEIFTGTQVLKPGSIPELIRAHDTSLSQTVSLSDDVDPAVERAIRRCLEREPARGLLRHTQSRWHCRVATRWRRHWRRGKRRLPKWWRRRAMRDASH